MEKAEISKLIGSFNAIKGYFDTTKKFMPQIAKLVLFIEEVIPLLNSIHQDLHQSSIIIPTASEKLDKVTSATEMATTEVMNIVDNVIERLNKMSTNLGEIDEQIEKESNLSESIKEKTEVIRQEVDGSQDDLFSIMNALQFQDITTQQINSIANVIDTVQAKLGELLQGFDEEGFKVKIRNAAFDADAEFDFKRSAESQQIADEIIKNTSKEKNIQDSSREEVSVDTSGGSQNTDSEESGSDEAILGVDGQPDVSAIKGQINNTANKK